MKAKHGNRFVSKIPKENAEILVENLKEYATKPEPSAGDRARNLTFCIRDVCCLTVSLVSGSLAFYTDMNEKELKKFMSDYFSKGIMEEFAKNLNCNSNGAHFPKRHGSVNGVIVVNRPAVILYSFTCRVCGDYNDFHFHLKMPKGAGTIKDSRKGYVTDGDAGAHAKQNYLSDVQIMKSIEKPLIENGSISVDDARKIFNKDRSSIHRRLKKLENQGLLKRMSDYPLLFSRP